VPPLRAHNAISSPPILTCFSYRRMSGRQDGSASASTASSQPARSKRSSSRRTGWLRLPACLSTSGSEPSGPALPRARLTASSDLVRALDHELLAAAAVNDLSLHLDGLAIAANLQRFLVRAFAEVVLLIAVRDVEDVVGDRARQLDALPRRLHVARLSVMREERHRREQQDNQGQCSSFHLQSPFDTVRA